MNWIKRFIERFDSKGQFIHETGIATSLMNVHRGVSLICFSHKAFASEDLNIVCVVNIAVMYFCVSQKVNK